MAIYVFLLFKIFFKAVLVGKEKKKKWGHNDVRETRR